MASLQPEVHGEGGARSLAGYHLKDIPHGHRVTLAVFSDARSDPICAGHCLLCPRADDDFR